MEPKSLVDSSYPYVYQIQLHSSTLTLTLTLRQRHRHRHRPELRGEDWGALTNLQVSVVKKGNKPPPPPVSADPLCVIQ
jgi:hypothetical protein